VFSACSFEPEAAARAGKAIASWLSRSIVAS
jgi:hypothetical protein